METNLRTAETPLLNIVYEQTGPDSGDAIVLLHGFPYDVRQYDEMRDTLADPKRRIIVPGDKGTGRNYP
jgi:pimeloyl-ACP methyl ester carboxylesterase